MMDLVFGVIIGMLGLALFGLGLFCAIDLHRQGEEIRIYKKELEKEERAKREALEEQRKYEDFIPYLVCAVRPEKIFDDNGEEVGELEMNTFHTIIFEKDGKGQLFSGQGWIDLTNVIRNPVREMQAPMKVLQNTPLKNGPGLGYHTICEVKQNEIVEVNDIFGVWCKIKLSNGVEGYVYYKNLR